MKIKRSAGPVLVALVSAVILEPSANGQAPLLKDHRNSWASFDCKRAVSRVEKLICGDVELSQQDGRQDFLYLLLLRHAAAHARPRIKAGQRAWLRKRDACAIKECLTDLYDVRETALMSQIDRWDRMLRRGVARVGQCQSTTIEYIGPRLGNVPSSDDRPDDSGTSVGFANGVRQVSYDLERPVARSRIGDRVRVCLVSIPKNCPPGDDRGRFYRVTNLRTKERWEMPDSQHMCGGA